LGNNTSHEAPEGEVVPSVQQKPTAVGGTAVPENAEHTDGRALGDWKSRFDGDASKEINAEAWILVGALALFLTSAGFCLGLARQTVEINLGFAKLGISFELLATFFTGCVGGVTFSMKWLIHSVAKAKWNLDRRYWRLMVPLIGGVYACVVVTLFNSGMLGSAAPTEIPAIGKTAALAFLVGYFSDGVSGLLSNIANAVFGTLEKK
jgi:hypothetical protein